MTTYSVNVKGVQWPWRLLFKKTNQEHMSVLLKRHSTSLKGLVPISVCRQETLLWTFIYKVFLLTVKVTTMLVCEQITFHYPFFPVVMKLSSQETKVMPIHCDTKFRPQIFLIHNLILVQYSSKMESHRSS